MSKRNIMLFPILIWIMILLNGCSMFSVPLVMEEKTPLESARAMQDVSASADMSLLDAEMVYADFVQTNFMTGQLDTVTARSLTLFDSDGAQYSFICSYELIQSNIETLSDGSLVTVEYYGILSGDTQLPSVVEITVEASPDEMLVMYAQEILDTMTLEEKVGQLFLAHYPSSDAPETTLALQPGGYILFSQDFADKTPNDVLTAVQSCQQNANVPLLIGVDEEGGTVNRISKYEQFRSQPFSSPQSLYADGGWDAIVSDTIEKAALLKSLGINLNLAPVCDVSTDPSDFIYKRTFGEAVAQTTEYVKTVVETMVQEQVGCVLKHFPGYGGNADTHTGSAYDERPYETFSESDFLPFEGGIAAGAGAVMISHNIVACMDETAPASLSAPVHDILRDELGFDGVIITDDLNMQAVLQYAGEQDAAVLAVLSGNDMIITPNMGEQAQAVLSAVEDGTVTQERIDESVLRILVWKMNLGIIE